MQTIFKENNSRDWAVVFCQFQKDYIFLARKNNYNVGIIMVLKL